MKDLITIISHNEFVSLRKITNREKGIHGYYYLHEDRCNGKIVAILPYRFKNDKIQYLLRNEYTPCWNTKEKVISSITGGVDTGVSIIDTCINELLEEAGYLANENDFIYLGKMKGTKSCDTNYYLYTIDLTDNNSLDAMGDGSELEKQSYCFWGDIIDDSLDPFVYALYFRLNKYLKEKYIYE
jgi:8-oxo-dGTP pyrophosphatase MutT (NUDIX family)